MQKKLIALAVAGMVAAPLAMAQSSVTIYGVADLGYQHDSSHVSSGVSSRNKMQQGNGGASRIGFRGTEDLGNGLRAGFIYELGVTPDEGSVNTTSARTSVLNVAGDFGTVQLGRQMTPQGVLLGAVDPFGNGGVGAVSSIYASTTRLNNLFAYVSPNFNGFSVVTGYTWNGIGTEGVGNESGSPGDAEVFAFAPFYSNGPIYVGLNYHQVKLNSTGVADGARTRVMDLGASYDFGVVKLSGLYGRVSSNNTLESLTGMDKLTRWMVGASAPVSEAGTVLLSYTDSTADRSSGLRDLDASQWAIGYRHRLSNRTSLYARYSKASYNTPMRAEVAAGTFNAATALLGADSTSFNAYRSAVTFGLTHSF